MWSGPEPRPPCPHLQVRSLSQAHSPWVVRDPLLSPSSCARIRQEHPLPLSQQGPHPLAGPLRPLPETLRPHHRVGREGSSLRPRGRPRPARTGDFGRPLFLQSPGTCSLGPHLRGALHPLCPDQEEPLATGHWVPPLPSSCLCAPAGGPHRDALGALGAPSWAEPRVPGHKAPTWGRSPGPWLTRGEVPDSGAPPSTPGCGRSGLTRGVPGGLAPGPGGGEDQRREEEQRRRGRHGGRRASDVALGPGRSAAWAPAPHGRGVGLQRGARNRARRCGGRARGAQPLPGRCSAPRGEQPPGGRVCPSHLTSGSPLVVPANPDSGPGRGTGGSGGEAGSWPSAPPHRP